jgi:uncharacterized protein (DUF1697 family)
VRRRPRPRRCGDLLDDRQRRLHDPRPRITRVERSLETALERRFGVETRILVRTLAQMRALVEAIDACWSVELDEKRNVVFLAHEIDDERVREGLEPKPEIETVTYLPGALLWSARRSALTRSSMLKLSRLQIYRQMTVRSPSGHDGSGS